MIIITFTKFPNIVLFFVLLVLLSFSSSSPSIFSWQSSYKILCLPSSLVFWSSSKWYSRKFWKTESTGSPQNVSSSTFSRGQILFNLFQFLQTKFSPFAPRSTCRSDTQHMQTNSTHFRLHHVWTLLTVNSFARFSIPSNGNVVCISAHYSLYTPSYVRGNCRKFRRNDHLIFWGVEKYSLNWNVDGGACPQYQRRSLLSSITTVGRNYFPRIIFPGLTMFADDRRIYCSAPRQKFRRRHRIPID